MDKKRAKELLQRLDDYAERMVKEGQYLQKVVKEIRKEVGMK